MKRSFATRLACVLVLLLTAGRAVASSVAPTLLYEGRLLNTLGAPVTSAVVFRFSFWKSADWGAGDASAGSINTGAGNYGQWQETQTITPNADGLFRVDLGAVNALPQLDASVQKYLQVEVKNDGAPDTSFVLLDPTGDAGADADDRKLVNSMAYAQNAQSLDGHVVGTASGNVLILGADGRISPAQMGTGTTSQNFTINTGDTAGDTTLTFGTSLGDETITYSAGNDWFAFSDDVRIEGDADVAGNVDAGGDVQAQGNVIINGDNDAADAVLTFGNDLGAQSLVYSSTNDRFEFSTDVHIAGNLTVEGTINGVDVTALGAEGALKVTDDGGLNIAISEGTYRLGGELTHFVAVTGVAMHANAINYVFFGSGGLTVQNDTFPTDEAFIPLARVTTNGSDITSIDDWRVAQSDDRESDDVVKITPEYDKSSYQGDGADNVGRLSLSQDNINKRNYYQWTTTEATLQDYDIFVHYQLPKDFVGWDDTGTPAFSVQYRSTSASTADNELSITVYDTNGAPVSLVGGGTHLASTSWTSADLGFADGSTWTAGNEIMIKLTVSAKNSQQMHLGSIQLHYRKLQP